MSSMNADAPIPTITIAKLALIIDDQILAYLRDDNPNIPFPSKWDLPGGNIEPGETPEACALRELEEEFGLSLTPDRPLWRSDRGYGMHDQRGLVIFGGILLASDVAAIRFGDEGQYWQLMSISDFTCHSDAVPVLQAAVKNYVAAQRS